ncbi:carboxylate-amine ligase [Paeniglutamicibacter antarcticus]|uniref:Putative glutamate--cysteine ligase 2 n=1 Tax=Paeniglutamicibacter antarcticus TaxID=494023 RepID=A0ABP9TQI6_9MICC
MRTFGIEEEFFFIRPDTGYPAAPPQSLHEQIEELDAGNDTIHSELLACQLETSSPVFTHSQEAIDSVSRMRRTLSGLAAEAGLQLHALGTPPRIQPTAATISASDRYHAINKFCPAIAAEHYIGSTHVHVGVEDLESGVKALNSLRPWLPLLTALGANSPYWRGADTGFASWRAIHNRRWSVQGIPPYFAGPEDYSERMEFLLSSDVVLDDGHIGWGARLSTKYPTVEVRVADAQLQTADTVLLALIIRALVTTGLGRASAVPTAPPEVYDVAHWQAAKFGIQGNHLNLRTGTKTSMAAMFEELLIYTKDALAQSEDTGYVANGLERIMRQGNGAMVQRQHFHAGGFSEVLERSASWFPM